MIIVRLSLWQKLKLLFGWYLQIEEWPIGQSYYQYVLGPWETPRQFRSRWRCERCGEYIEGDRDGHKCVPRRPPYSSYVYGEGVVLAEILKVVGRRGIQLRDIQNLPGVLEQDYSTIQDRIEEYEKQIAVLETIKSSSVPDTDPQRARAPGGHETE